MKTTEMKKNDKPAGVNPKMKMSYPFKLNASNIKSSYLIIIFSIIATKGYQMVLSLNYCRANTEPLF